MARGSMIKMTMTDGAEIGVYRVEPKSARRGGLVVIQEIFGITERLIRSLVDDTGAEIIVPLGGALIPYVVDPDDLAKATGVQVLNTKAIGIRFAEMCVTFGMTQSGITYPRTKIDYSDFTKRV